MTAAKVSFEVLNAALTRCMAEHPPEGVELKLHVDANAMASLWSRMVLGEIQAVDAADVSTSVLDAIQRWLPAH